MDAQVGWLKLNKDGTITKQLRLSNGRSFRIRQLKDNFYNCYIHSYKAVKFNTYTEALSFGIAKLSKL